MLKYDTICTILFVVPKVHWSTLIWHHNGFSSWKRWWAHQPIDFIQLSTETKVCGLLKNFNELHQALRRWNKCFNEFLVKFELCPQHCKSLCSQKLALTTTTIFVDDGFIVDKDKAKLSLSNFIKHVMLFMCFSSLGNWRIIEFPHHLTMMSFFMLLKMTIIVNQIFLASKLLGVLSFACLVRIQASHMLSMSSLNFQIIPTKLIAMLFVILHYLNGTTTFGLCYVMTNTNNHMCRSCKENMMIGSGSLLYLNQARNSWFSC
jgi:hypothetical protein